MKDFLQSGKLDIRLARHLPGLATDRDQERGGEMNAKGKKIYFPVRLPHCVRDNF
jgi:hypothetical protein